MKRFFCTLFDSHYLLKGVVMLRTLKRCCPDAHVFVLCMDKATKDVLLALLIEDITCIELGEIESEELLNIKSSRSRAEYCWTLSPVFPWYIFEKYQEVDAITYLDADLCFYSSLEPIFEEINGASIVIIEHRFPPQFKHMEIRGRFCVEWVGFRRNEEGLACLRLWKEQCVEWCYHRLEDNRMGDQKYLDAWPSMYADLHILEYPGAGVAPWNYSQYKFSYNDNCIMVNNSLLIFYHFHQFQILNNSKFDRLSSSYRALGKEPELVYGYYEAEIISALNDVKKIIPSFSGGIKPSFKIKLHRAIQVFFPQKLKESLKKFIRI